MLHPFFKGIDWNTIGKDPIPYDKKALKKIIKKKHTMDIFETEETISETNEAETTEDNSVRQSEFDVKLENPEDFEQLFKDGKEVKRGWLMKRNPWFINQKRLFILTNKPKLLYFKNENTLRGEIVIDAETKAKKV